MQQSFKSIKSIKLIPKTKNDTNKKAKNKEREKLYIYYVFPADLLIVLFIMLLGRFMININSFNI